jgi:hypothetical protein
MQLPFVSRAEYRRIVDILVEQRNLAERKLEMTAVELRETRKKLQQLQERAVAVQTAAAKLFPGTTTTFTTS